MATLEDLTGNNMLSHSSLTTWLDCGEKYKLTKVQKAVEKPSWFLIGGSTFHTVTELLDRGDERTVEELWAEEWHKQYTVDVTDKGWLEADVRAGGRASKEWPDKENEAWWTVNGPLMVHGYVAWWKEKQQEGWQFLLGPDGQPVIELPIVLEYGDVAIRGYVDRALVNPDGEAVVVDLKTGSHTPASTLQLGIYALGIERHLGVRPILGAYYMSRKNELTPNMSLLHYTPDMIHTWFRQAKTGIEAEIFVPRVSSMCGSCAVRQHCSAFPGAIPVFANTGHPF